MPLGRDRNARGRKGRQTPKRVADPQAGVAYEENWYRVMARQAELGELSTIGGDRVDPRPDDSSAAAPAHPAEEKGATLVELSSKRAARARARSAGTPGGRSAPRPPQAPKAAGPTRAEPAHAEVRIGVRVLEDPEGVYVHYLTGSPHAGFFRADWWPAGRRLTPVHLWRANHIGAAWDLEVVRRFFDGPARHADQLLATAPTEPPGSLARRTWMKGLLSSDLAREFGIARVCKTLHPYLPELVPDLDAEMMAWARKEWLGLQRVRGGWGSAEGWFETWELLEDVLVLRGDVLSELVRRVRDRTPGHLPVGRLGLVAAAFWESYWHEASGATRTRTMKSRARVVEAAGAKEPGATEPAPKTPAAKSPPRKRVAVARAPKTAR